MISTGLSIHQNIACTRRSLCLIRTSADHAGTLPTAISKHICFHFYPFRKEGPGRKINLTTRASFFPCSCFTAIL